MRATSGSSLWATTPTMRFLNAGALSQPASAFPTWCAFPTRTRPRRSLCTRLTISCEGLVNLTEQRSFLYQKCLIPSKIRAGYSTVELDLRSHAQFLRNKSSILHMGLGTAQSSLAAHATKRVDQQRKAAPSPLSTDQRNAEHGQAEARKGRRAHFTPAAPFSGYPA